MRRIAALLVPVLLAACSSERGGTEQPASAPPDLAVDPELLSRSLRLETRTFEREACEVAASCVGGPGPRLLLDLLPAVKNVGEGPVRLGEGVFSEARCGGASTLEGFLRWAILDQSGAELRSGAVDLPCLADGAGPGAASYTCSEQGLQAGWTQLDPGEDACSQADLTGLAPGLYELVLEVAPLPDDPNRTNDRASVPIEIPDIPCTGEACGAGCCPEGIACVEGRCAIADLAIDEDALLQSLRFDAGNFATNDCAVQEGCVGAPGDRRLLRFTLTTPNVGGADLFVGDPEGNPNAEYSACHNHFHMSSFARYRLLDLDGNVAAVGHKQAFCLMDTEPLGTHGPTSPQYDCEYQGISAGWTDSYGAGLDCQWIDITGVPEGDYLIDVEINGEGTYPEGDYSNNRLQVPVFVPADPSACIPQSEACGDGVDQDCDGDPDDGCPPLAANSTCGAAHAIDGSGTWTGEIPATPTTEIDNTCGGAGGALFFRFTVLAEEIVYLSTYGSAIDTVLSLRKEGCEGTEVACTDDGCGTGQSHFAGSLAPGNYVVAIQAKESGAAGLVKLKAQRSGCAGATEITGSGTFSGTTSGESTTMTGCGLGRGPDDLWYLTTCPGTTPVQLDTCGETAFDTVLELRAGSCRGETVACTDDTRDPSCEPGVASLLEQDLAGEGLWFLVVDGYLGSESGGYQLNASF